MCTTETPGTSWDDLDFRQILPAELDNFKDFAHDCFARMSAVTHGELAAEDYYEQTLQGFMQFFILSVKGKPSLGVATEYVRYPRFTILRIVGMAGEKPVRGKKFWRQFCQWAQLNGAVGVETFATPETVRLDERLGMKPYVTLMRYYIEEKYDGFTTR